MLVGYARVSTRDQSPALQLNALREAGCEKVFTEKASGAQRDRPELKAALADPTITVEEVAQQFGVQPSTFYRHIPGGRSSLSQPA